MNHKVKHLLTFDVEHWYEGYRHRSLKGWETVPPRDHVIVGQLFELLSKYNQSGTFFFTGRFAREFPYLVKRCSELGHEVASHSDEHRVIYRFSGEEEFRNDLKASLDILSTTTGKPILGYRAPKWSITLDNQDWVLGILADESLVYDSSFFPTLTADKSRKKGIPLQIQLRDGRKILEVPATGFNVGNITIPVAGGLYFRVFPAWVAKAMLLQKEQKSKSGMLYVHPYDLDTQSPNIDGGGLLFQLFRTYGVKGAWKKLEQLLREYSFTSIEKVLPTLIDLSENDK